jgi:coenzyme F420-reducing hydrogenase beta subunit
VDLGRLIASRVAHARDPEVAARAASGGVVTSIVRFMLQTGRADAAVVVTPAAELPVGGTFAIVRDPDGLLASCSSIYSAVPLGRVLRDTAADERLVVVGRPCQIRAVNRLAAANPALGRRTVLTISIFCAWLIGTPGVHFLARLAGITDPRDIRGVRYRAGTWPGSLRFSTECTERACTVAPAHTHGTSYYPAITPFVPPVCRRCYDVLGAEADLSAGDPWNLGLEPSDGHGYTLVLTRTPRGEAAMLDACFGGEYVQVDHAVTPAQLRQSQGNTIRIKRAGALLTRGQVHATDRAIRRYAAFSRIYASVVRLLERSAAARLVVNAYLRVIWRMVRKRADARLYLGRQTENPGRPHR